MDKKRLDGDSFGRLNFNPNDFTDEHFFSVYMQANGYEYISQDGCWRWIRKGISSSEFNSVTCNQLSEMQRFWLESRKLEIPGTSSNPLSVNAYNDFARWNDWHGAYVGNLGFISVPSSSGYGVQLYINGSWVTPGSEGFPVSVESFYRIVHEKTWTGGSVEGWGNVSPETFILGASSGLRFTGGDSYLNPLIDIANLCRILDSDPVGLPYLQIRFQEFWIRDKNQYEIPDWAIRDYLDPHYSNGLTSDVKEALQRHYGVMVRIISKEGYVNGKYSRYGNDHLIVSYNGLYHAYITINSYGTLGAVDESAIDDKQKTVYFIYRKHS